MTEAGEVGDWAIVKKLGERPGISSIAELAKWALPLQEEHLGIVLRSSLDLAAGRPKRGSSLPHSLPYISSRESDLPSSLRSVAR